MPSSNPRPPDCRGVAEKSISRSVARASGRADDSGDQALWIGGRRIAAPGDILVGPHQYEIALVKVARFGVRHVEDLQRHPASAGGGGDRAAVGGLAANL